MSQAKPSILYITLGCAKNEVDTDRMRALLLADGFAEAESADDADVAIVNTCSFLASATQESIEATLELAEVPPTACAACPSSCAAASRRATATTCPSSSRR